MGGRDNTMSCSIDSLIGGGASNKVCDTSRATIGGGQNNCITTGASGHAFIGSGRCNCIINCAGFIGGGYKNCVSGSYASISGGKCNTASCLTSTVGGGCNNTSASSYGVIGGGKGNCTGGGTNSGTVGGGTNNKVYTSHSTIGGGYANIICSCNYATIGGGRKNSITADYSTIAGGCCNLIVGGYPSFSNIAGGRQNKIDKRSRYSNISGGLQNIIQSNYSYPNSYFSSIGGGCGNQINSSRYSIIGGGYVNKIRYTDICPGTNLNANAILSGQYNEIYTYLGCSNNCLRDNVIAGGNNNRIYINRGNGCTDGNFIGGGCNNTIVSTKFSVIGGGQKNTISTKNDCFNSILGGYNNDISGGYCNAHIIGSNISASAQDTTFVNNLTTAGIIKYSGTFRIPHPDPIKTKTHTLNHSFVESPNAGDNIYRFTVSVKDGTSEIELPEYFKYLNCDVQVFVTPKNGFGIAYGIIDDELTKVTIHANLDIEYNVLIIGTRKDYHAVKSWKGTERLKTKGEIETYKNNLKNKTE